MLAERVIHRLGVWLMAGSMLLLSACATTMEGPVHAYAGPARPTSELALVQIPYGINLIAVDDISYEHAEAGDAGLQVYLTPGRHRLLVNYSEVFGDLSAAVAYTSDTFVFDIETRAGERYRLVHNGPEEPAAVEGPEGDIIIELVDARGQRHAAVRRIPVGILGQLGLTPPVATAPAPAAPAPAAPPASAAVTPPPAAGVAPPSSQQVLEALRNWWQRATPAERAEFRKWIVDHP